MAKSRGTCLYKEARLNIEPAFPGSTIAITLPAKDTSTFGSRTNAKRTVINEQSRFQDEDAFAKRHLASDGSMFFRRHHDYPRSFLWRMLDSRKTLEIQSVDLDQDSNHKLEANLTILLHFAAPIRPFCIAFAEPEDRDALTVFAITSANELYTITLHRDFFIKTAASEQEIGDWCKRSVLTQFMLRIPYRLVASSNNELLVSLDNGGILHLTRNNKDDTAWIETLYHETSWTGSVRGLLTWKREQKVHFDDTDLDVSTAAAVALSPDRKHILSACLNHKLRAWNITSGKPGVQTDLLGQPDRANDKATPYFIGPSQSTLMTVVNIPGGVDGANYHLVTYSPKQHQFKFWGVRDADDAEYGIYDAQSEVDFIPPVDELMDTTVWTLEEFFINPGPAGWRGAELWIRARSGPSSKIYSLKFDLNEDSAKLKKTWRDEWVCVDSGPLSVEALKQNPANPGEQDSDVSELYETDLTEKWLDFLFFPGQFTTATLEAALLIFRKGLERGRASQTTVRGTLKERISATVGAFLMAAETGDVDQDGFQLALSAQWQAFYGLVRDLHKRRGEYLSLAYDYESDMPWLVLSDYLSAIRQCSEPETISLNAPTFADPKALTAPLRKALANPDSRDLSRLLNAAASFRKSLPASFHAGLQRELDSELLQSKSLSVLDRMELMELNTNLLQQVSDEDVSLLVEELGTDVKDLTNETFLRAMQALGQEEQGRTNRRRQAARYGLSALLRVTQETLELNYNTLLDLLVLILFMHFEEDLSEDFDASEVYIEIINQLKDYMILTWLANTVWSRPAPTGPASEKTHESLSETFKNSNKQLPITQTVLEGVIGHRAFEASMPKGLKTELLTYWSRVWLGLLFKDETFDGAMEDLMGILLSQKEYDLASEFSKFLPDGSWSTYLKGRMHLQLGDNALASICFQKPAYNLGEYCSAHKNYRRLTCSALGMFSLEDADTINFIPPEQRDSFSDGLPKYYHHVLGLFEKSKAYPFVAEFAHLGLQSLRGREDAELKTDLLSRLFNASIQTSRFEEAYSAMVRHTDVAL